MVAKIILGSFRLDYEYEIEYEYDFRISNQFHVGFREERVAHEMN